MAGDSDGDHPRSRGVYPTTCHPHGRLPGSSPLARGLRHAYHVSATRNWIIPARAGFTTRIRGRRSGTSRIIPARAGFTGSIPLTGAMTTDHPRSRGVYVSPAGPVSTTAGSSPLARGLPTPRRSRQDCAWIIPARAGFTFPFPRPSPNPTDHPRSRGVYTLTVLLLTHAVGSSPLARGLLEAVAHHIASLRIIPARAGFTIARGFICSSQSDHPRSRGVYLSLSLSRVAIPAGIIPARAGFTLTPSSHLHALTDHPRSRGVYVRGGGRLHLAEGSSPLARGLLGGSTTEKIAHRIIPARAGFTTTGDTTKRSGPGSSPLARGLLHDLRHSHASARIIPARAGFTPPGHSGHDPVGDHPRSRGVYVVLIPPVDRLLGSSPLARGLQWVAGPFLCPAGIIPARAGFTLPHR